MTPEEFDNIRAAIKSAYPNSNVMPDKYSIRTWYSMLYDIDYRTVHNAVMELICTHIYPPSIAEIRQQCMERSEEPILDFDEAWGIVQKAIRTHGREHPQEAYAEMDSITASVVKNLGWTALCIGENQEASRANFREAYKIKANEAKKRYLIPETVKREKAELQKRIAPAVESKPVRQLPDNSAKKDTDIRDLLDEKQMEDRARRFAEIRERAFGNYE